MVMLYGGRIRAEGTVDSLLQDTERTVIRTGKLDQKTIDRIEEVLRTAGASIEQVESPKQRLEDLFLQIVDQARRERAATSGVTEGGHTAAFLRDGEADGEDLVDRLQRAQPAGVAARVVTDESNRAKPSDEVLQSLLSEDASPPSRATVDAPAEAAPSDVDQSMIDRLTGDGAVADKSDEPT
jgi:hypothetical protein